MVSESYLQTLVQVANDRFQVNAQRMERFRQAFLEQVGGLETSPSDFYLEGSHPFDPADMRKERMRREGLLRQESLRASAASNGAGGRQSEGVEDDDADEDFGFDLLSPDLE